MVKMAGKKFDPSLMRDTDRLNGKWSQRSQDIIDRGFNNYTRVLREDMKTHSTFLVWLKNQNLA